MGQPRRVLAVASGGGHWVQLCRLAPAWDGCDVTYVTTQKGYREVVSRMAAERGQTPPGFFVVTEVNRWQKGRILKALVQLVWILLRCRPDVIITTGAAPGAMALRIGSLMGCRTVWIDSIANSEKLSMSGGKVAGFTDLWLTQWPHLADEQKGPRYRGSVI